MRVVDACDAIRVQRRVQFNYKGEVRIVEMHTVGYSRDSNPLCLGWQVRGGSRSNSPTPWRVFNLDEITDERLLDERSEAPRPGYARCDRAIHQILCEP